MEIDSLTNEIEKVSRSYADSFKINRTPDWFILKLQEELGELIQSYLMMVGQARRKQKSDQELGDDFSNEVADVFCHLLLLANHHNINLEQKIKDKWLIWSEGKSE